MFQVGDKVWYEQVEGIWIIEKEYACGGMFLIGREDAFCDCVPAHMLKKVEDE